VAGPNTANPGILALWNDCAAGAEREYEHWYRTEHLAERVAVEGFVAGWRYIAVEAEPGYFTHYETQSPGVLYSAAYRERLDNPTPLTRGVMANRVFFNASRTVCERTLRIGDMRGAFATVVRFEQQAESGDLPALARALGADDDVLRAELWSAVAAPGSASMGESSTEQGLRGPDDTIDACVLLETADEGAARAVAQAARARVGSAARIGVYRLLCALIKERPA
jgi:hypothetical protein